MSAAAPVAPLVVFANFLSDLAVDLDEGEVLAQWARQAPRKAWLLRPGDVLVTPVPLSAEFRRYVGALTGVAADRTTVLEVPPAGAVPLARAVREAGLVERVRELVGGTGAALLPTALDGSALAFARELGLTVYPYPTIDAAAAALRTTMLLNTKAGFRAAAERAGMRLPAGRVCRRAEVEGVVRELLEHHERVVVKPDRSAGGHGLRFLARGDLAGAELVLDSVGGPEGTWVVEECVDVAASVSVQVEVDATEARAVFSGAMRTAHGSFTGYVSPLPPSCAHVGEELEEWGTRLGDHLAGEGYLGPFGLDALVGADGVAYASESNVRRTATTTPHAMVTRLTAASAVTRPAWAVAKGRSGRPFGFEEAVHRLREHRLDFDPALGEGVVLYSDAPPDGTSWRYAVIAAHAEGVREREERLAAALEFERPA
ncbi:peptide ligase PGM1-related protein [Streptomyces sp. G-G2]|uniref:preATP grasp domain-containing protein n=1 Tax=Streptomyces sp. G-G2 TaxID=3046201 RepID=UPI0024B8CE9C|nr:peptide ligase PGM1-related protein [Streptomyces sp. G-G2]MDJ0382599.1 peptide ligase PGM1-related protein [Streptomyces sp. G-G2]